jgi:hypothetical protein
VLRGRVENLRFFTSNQDREAARINGKKGGIASGVTRRKRRAEEERKRAQRILKPWERYLEMSAFSKLRIKHQNLLFEFVKCGNAAEAARRAGYKPKYARDVASRILQRRDVQKGLYCLMLACKKERNPAAYGLLELESGELVDVWD